MNKKENIIWLAKNEINRCAACYDAPCNKIYKNINPERIIRALKFENHKGARTLIKNEITCFEKNDICKEKCPLNINVDLILEDIINKEKLIDNINQLEKVNLSTDICGVKLENPFLLSSSVIGSTYEMCKRALEMGWAGVVTKTISMIKIEESSPRFSALKSKNNTFLGFKNIEQLSEKTTEENMLMIKKLKKEFPNKVIIASIMGRNDSEWAYLAKEATKAGADLLELNFSCPNMKEKETGSDVGQNPQTVEEYTRIVRENTDIPILAKMTPNITDITLPAIAAKKGGADGIAAINTIKSITGVDLESQVPEPQVNNKSALGGYSGQAVKPIALRFIADMVKCSDIKDLSYSGMGGIYTYKDAIEFILLGCSNVQVTTSVMEYGYRIIDDLVLGLKIYMLENNYQNVSDFIGKSIPNLVPNDDLEKKTIELPSFNHQTCLGCGRCFLSCRDGGHQAITFSKERKPILNAAKCVGCQLCTLVCPNNSIKSSRIRIKKND